MHVIHRRRDNRKKPVHLSRGLLGLRQRFGQSPQKQTSSAKSISYYCVLTQASCTSSVPFFEGYRMMASEHFLLLAKHILFITILKYTAMLNIEEFIGFILFGVLLALARGAFVLKRIDSIQKDQPRLSQGELKTVLENIARWLRDEPTW